MNSRLMVARGDAPHERAGTHYARAAISTLHQHHTHHVSTRWCTPLCALCSRARSAKGSLSPREHIPRNNNANGGPESAHANSHEIRWTRDFMGSHTGFEVLRPGISWGPVGKNQDFHEIRVCCKCMCRPHFQIASCSVLLSTHKHGHHNPSHTPPSLTTPLTATL